MANKTWTVALSSEAERDFVAIMQWTAETFGPRQAETYKAVLLEAITALAGGPDIQGSRERPEIGAGYRTLHVRRRGKPGRHFLLFRQYGARTVLIVRILHDSMELSRHLGEDET